jgi:N-acetyl-1-D-myo-inositol-2-amino-2-deoxy-alpha-D-glucopyranoside deacetylase
LKGIVPPELPSLSGRTVLAVFAHPDDESLACGGTIARLADAGVSVVLLCASRGERGAISDPTLVADGDLAAARTRELMDAAAVLGIADVVIADHPDGDLRWDDVPELHREIVELVERHQPAGVITFAEDGLYWHLDHIGVHERTYTAVRSFGDAAPPLYYVTMPKGIMRAVVGAAHAKGGAPPDSSFWGIEPDAFGDAAKPATFTLDVRPWIGRKLTALRCHRTQMGRQNPLAWIDEEDARRWLGTEYFRRADIAGRDESLLEQLGEAVPSA